MKNIILLLIVFVCFGCSQMTEPDDPFSSINPIQDGAALVAAGNVELTWHDGIVETESQSLSACAIFNVYQNHEQAKNRGQFTYRLVEQNKNIYREIVADICQYQAVDGVIWLIGQVTNDSKGCQVGTAYQNHGEYCPYRDCDCDCHQNCQDNDCDCDCHLYCQDGCLINNGHDCCCLHECCECPGCTGGGECLMAQCRLRQQAHDKDPGKGNGKQHRHQNRQFEQHAMQCRVGQYVCVRLCDGERAGTDCDRIAWKWVGEKEGKNLKLSECHSWQLCNKNMIQGHIAIK